MAEEKRLVLRNEEHFDPLIDCDAQDAYWMNVEAEVLPFLSVGERHMLMACDLLIDRLVRLTPGARLRDEMMDEIISELHEAHEKHHRDYRWILKRWSWNLTRDLERARRADRPSLWQRLLACVRRT